MLRNTAFWIVCLALLAPGSVLTVEDVVRLHLSGTTERELIARIRDAAEVDFDLESEMLEELETVGLPASVIQAMQRRQARDDRRTAREAVPDSDHDTGPTLTIRLNPKKAKNRDLRLYDSIDMGLADYWKLGNAPETMRFSDVALFVACRTADHVPDGWRTRTRLAWDAYETPRHRMLVFEGGASWGRATLRGRLGMGGGKRDEEGRNEAPVGAGKPGILELEVPESLQASLSPDVPHDLSLGIALEVAGRYYPWIVVSLEGVVLEQEPLELEAIIKGMTQPGLKALDLDFGEAERARWEHSKVCTRGCRP
jgi:hypothetical protein